MKLDKIKEPPGDSKQLATAWQTQVVGTNITVAHPQNIRLKLCPFGLSQYG